MLLVILCFVVFFTLIASGGMLLFYRQALLQRVSDVVTLEPRHIPLVSILEQARSWISGLANNLGRLAPKSGATQLKQQLAQAGYRNDSAVGVFYAIGLLMPIAWLLLTLLTGSLQADPFEVIIGAVGAGFVFPGFFLKRMIKARQRRLQRGLPDALDFLVICIEAGLGIDQATARTANELRLSHSDLSDELNFLVLEQRAGRPRSDAWSLFAERTDLEPVRILARALVQAEQFGTGVAKTLRIHSESMRTERRQSIEERAAKTSVKMVFPLTIFIFPSLFLVTLGPEAITMAEAFQMYLPH